MKERTRRKLRASAKAVLTLLGKYGDLMMVFSKSEHIRNLRKLPELSFVDEYWKNYYPGGVRQVAEKLVRNGQVEIRTTQNGIEVKITDRGKVELLRYKLNELLLERKPNWDGKWRMVFFDVEELRRGKRDALRRWLIRLGLRRMQMSVWVYPYPLEREVKFLRELLGVPHGVKLAVVERLDNDADLREIFDL